jgi:hypothetical protein
MAFSGESAIWYEILVDGQLLAKRESWPVLPGDRYYTKRELTSEKRAMLEDQARRRQKAGGGQSHSESAIGAGA